MRVLYMAFTDYTQPHTFSIVSHHTLAHTPKPRHTAGTCTHHTHTYNILPCFESICGSAQSPLHKLFVINERARGLLLWWLPERTQLHQWELRKQRRPLKALMLCLFDLFIPHKTHTWAHTVFCGWIRLPAPHGDSPAGVDTSHCAGRH